MNKSQNTKSTHICSLCSTHCDPVLPLSRLNIIFISSGHIEAAYVFFLIFPPVYLSLNNIFQKALSTQDVTTPVNDRIFRVFFLWGFNSLLVRRQHNSLFLTQQVQLIFSILRCHNISSLKIKPLISFEKYFVFYKVIFMETFRKHTYQVPRFKL